MSDQISTIGGSLQGESQTPSIRSFQIDPNGLGGISESINLFRGDINLPLKLITITSRSGLQAGASLVYQSNLGKQADTWNQDAPTGLVGLGWKLGLDYIVMNQNTTISPDVDEYFIVSDGQPNRLHLIGKQTDYWEFELENYKFWQIRYFPLKEKWVIIKEEGNRFVYGGEKEDKTISPVQYKVKWRGENGNWLGSSIDTIGQENFAFAWNLVEVANPFGDGLTFSYENDLIKIGNNGLPFTRASRLKQIAAPFSRSIHFFYAEKEEFEYQPLHIDPDGSDLHAFQDPLEIHYLEKIELRNAADAASAPNALLTTILFSYEFANLSIEHPNDDLYKKRYLTEALFRTSSGLDLPNFNFKYYNRDEDLKATINRGALRQIVYPQGGTITYDFQLSALSGTSRSTNWTPNGTTRFWFTGSYAVMAEYDGISVLTIQIFSWNGQWVIAPQTFNLNAKIDLSTLKVTTEEEFFAMSYISSGANKSLFTILFHKQPGRFGQWLVDDQARELRIANDGEGLITTGDDFVMALTSPGRFFLLRWDNRNKVWIDDTNDISVPSNKQYAIAGKSNFLAIASHDDRSKQVELKLYYLDEAQQFQPASLQEQRLTGVEWEKGAADSFWALGNNYAAMTYVTRKGDDDFDYSVQIQQWNNLFQADLVVDKQYTLPADTLLPFSSTVASENVVGNVGNLFRYNGLDWVEDEIPVVVEDEIKPKIVYGSDSAISVNRNFGQLDFFNPYENSWEKILNEPGFDFTPTATGNYFSIGREIFIRQNTGELKRLGSFPQNISPDSIINRAPLFFAYEDQSGNTFVWPMKNGALAEEPFELTNQRIVNDSDDPGTNLVGLTSIVTYEGRFDNPSRFNLYQFVNEGIEGELKTFPVIRLSINDGYPERQGNQEPSAEQFTRYYYDCDNVTVNPSGKVTEFAAATTVYGESDIADGICYPPPAKTKLGSTEFRYYNNGSAVENGLFFLKEGENDPGYLYTYLNGMIFDNIDYDAEGNPVNRNISYYEVREKYAEIGEPDTLKQLIGAYVKQTGTESTQYEEPVVISSSVTGLRSFQNIQQQVFQAHGFNLLENDTGNLIPARRSGQFHLFSDNNRQTWFPVTIENGEVSTAKGVVRIIENAYSFETGLLLSDSTSSFNTEGQKEVFKRKIYYAWQVPQYPLFKERHIWTPIALSIRLAMTDGVNDDFVPIDFSLTTYKNWGNSSTEDHTPWAPESTWVALSAKVYDPANSSGIPVKFNQWLGAGETEAGWRRVSLTTQRTSTGALITALDVAKVPSTNILGKNDTFRIAEFTNATREEASYQGFEDYESMDAWAISSGDLKSLLVTGDAHTGLNSLQIPANTGQELSKEFSLTENKKYILAYWVKTPNGFDSASGEAAWEVKDTAGTVLQSFPIKDSASEWAYQSQLIQLSEDEAADTIKAVKFSLINKKTNSSAAFLIDDIMMSPLESEVDAVVFHPRFGDKTAEVGLNGNTRITTYDSYRRAMGVIENNQVKNVTNLFNLRQWEESDNFTFDEAYPNMTLDIRAAEKSAPANLTQGEDWKNNWSSSNLETWETKDNQLIHTTNARSNIRFNPSEDYENYGAKVSLVQPLDDDGTAILPSKSLGMALGTDLSVEWMPDTCSWILTLDGQEITLHSPVSAITSFGTEWLLMAPKDPVSGKTSVYFMVNGLTLFSKQNTPAIEGSLRLEVAEEGFGFESIACFRSPITNAQYLDGAGKELQRIGLEGTSLIVQQTLYDLIGRAILSTKATRVENTPLKFIEDFIESFDPVSGLMEGLVSTLNPEDEGYPYLRSAFKQTAQMLVEKQSQPGKDFAIIDGDEGSNPHVTTYTYGTNTAGEIKPLAMPANEYFITRTTNPNGQQLLKFTTKGGQEIANLEGPLEDQSFATTLFFYDNAQRLVKILPPEGVKALQEGSADAGDWATINTYNFLGELISINEPDSGGTEYIFDLAGRTRFVRTANDANATGQLSTILYSKYDNLGRTTEKGYFRAVWNRETFEALAISDPDYPASSQDHMIVNRFEYNGDGSNPTALGRLEKAYTFGENAGHDVAIEYSYDLEGNLLKLTESVPGYDDEERSLQFTYNNLDSIIQTIYPEGAGIKTLYHQYNSLGQLLAIGNAEDPEAYASYSYYPSGAVDTAKSKLENGEVLSIQNKLNSPGWLINKKTQLNAEVIYDESVKYTEGGYNGSGYFDGKAAAATYQDGEDVHSYQYLYDNLSRIKVAECPEDPALSLGVESQVEYDSNGNILSWSKGGIKETNEYDPNSDQLNQVSIDGTPVDGFDYDGNGNATKADRLGLDKLNYEEDSNLTKSIELGSAPKVGIADTKVAFTYSPGGNRSLKKLLDKDGNELSSRLYLRNLSDQSLYEEVRKKDKATVANQYLYGPDGLSGIIAGGNRYYVIRDGHGSVRKVVNQNGTTVASFKYTPFGITISGANSTEADLIVYRYTGQEYDEETGLYAFPARMYDPETGRFFSTDPKRVGNTPYAYVLNNPVNLVDPDGEEPFSIAALLISIIISAIIGTAAGLITYLATYEKGSFDVGKFFLYGLSGFVTGAISGGLAYLAGPVAAGGIASFGGLAATTTGRSIAIGVIQGAAGGAIGGASAGALNQVGVNLIEGRDAGENVGRQLGIGFGLGITLGAVGGGLKGFAKFKFNTNNAAAAGGGAPGGAPGAAPGAVGGAGGAVGPAAPLLGAPAAPPPLTGLQKSALAAIDLVTRSTTATFLRAPLFGGSSSKEQKGAGQNGVSGASVSGATLAEELGDRDSANGSGLNLISSYAGQRGAVASSANQLKTPVRSANNRGPEDGDYTKKLRAGWKTIHAF